jgi:hypothetical protein
MGAGNAPHLFFMTLLNEVIGFARDYINNRNHRTPERKEKIRNVLRSLTGELLNFGCSTCYIEALFKILNLNEMATPKGYQLKKGVVLQAFGDASKTCTNLTLTDELAEWYLKFYPEKAVLFEKIPRMRPVVPVVEIKKEVPVVVEPTIDSIADKLIESVTEKPKKTYKRKAKK